LLRIEDELGDRAVYAGAVGLGPNKGSRNLVEASEAQGNRADSEFSLSSFPFPHPLGVEAQNEAI